MTSLRLYPITEKKEPDRMYSYVASCAGLELIYSLLSD